MQLCEWALLDHSSRAGTKSLHEHYAKGFGYDAWVNIQG